MRTLVRFFVFLFIIVIGIAALAFYWTFYKPLPDYSATIKIEGLQNEVDIHWDPYGVPHIYADNETDLYFAAGYVHAQDRLWQMTLMQISAEGRFAEFFGEDLIPYDEYQRTLGFWHTAKKIETEADEHLLRLLQAYSDGINAYTAANYKKLPIEFSLTGVKPIEWTPTHSFALSRLMAWDQNINWWSEMTLAYLGTILEPEVMEELFPVYDDRLPTTMDAELSRQLASAVMPVLDTELALRSTLGKTGTSVGSNAWVADGSRTESGFPILAGDPHMGLSMPGNWYEIHYSVNGKSISGGTIPGAPFIVLGQNQKIAWSFTNIMADDTDFFIEITDSTNPDHYFADSTANGVITEPFTIRNEIIKVKDGDDQLFRIRHTGNGPVISDTYPNQELMDNKIISLRWVGHEVSHEMWALYNMNKAQDMDEFTSAISHFKSPGMNMMYADRENNIAMFSVARLPIRDFNPVLFRKGWDPAWQWKGWVPENRMPRVVNPAKGWIANANNKLHTDDYPYYISTFWEPSSRIQRIEQYFEQTDTVSIELFRTMQYDSYSEHARDIARIILPVLRNAPEQYNFDVVIPYIENWDYRYELNSTAASLLDVFFLNLSKNTLADIMGEAAYNNFIRLENLPVRVVARLLRDDSILFNKNESLSTRDQMIWKSMNDAVNWLTDTYGEEPFQWRWEQLHTIRFRPPLLAEVADDPASPAALRAIVNNVMSKGPFPVTGHGMSVNNGQYDWENPFEMTLGASIRRIVDLSSMNRTLSVIPTGQSGNPFSDHFGDQTVLWLEGRMRYFYQDSTFFRDVSHQTMKLIPESNH